jgi:hypothetical protein
LKNIKYFSTTIDIYDLNQYFVDDLVYHIAKFEIDGIENPYKKKGFDISSIESFSSGKTIHRVGAVKLIYRNNTCLIKFKKKDFFQAALIFTLIVSNDYGWDKDLRAYLNDFKLDIRIPKKIRDQLLKINNSYNETLAEQIYNFNATFKIKNLNSSTNSFLICFTNTEDGASAFEFFKALIIYPITPDHYDEYYADK